MLRNIFVSDGVPLFSTGYRYNLEQPRHRSDLNLYYDCSGQRASFQNRADRLSWTAWKRLGFDRHSIVADPRFRNIKKRDFTLHKDSPAFRIGFVPIDLSTLGPRR
jgi:hypothetical protein